MNTREKILAAAARLFATQGYTDTSLARVARETHVSKALVLWYFNSKDELFRAALRQFLAPYAIDEEMLLGLGEIEQVEKVIDDYHDFIAEHLYSVKFVLGQVVREEDNSKELVAHVSELYRLYCGLLTSILARGRERGVFMSAIKPAEEAALIMATLNGLLVQQLMDQPEPSAVHSLLRLLKHSVRLRLCRSPVQTEGVSSRTRTARSQEANPAR